MSTVWSQPAQPLRGDMSAFTASDWSTAESLSPPESVKSANTSASDEKCGHDQMKLEEEEEDSVWTPEVEEIFREAMELYPPCGRRKIIIPDEGKMYGRNELIARHIQSRTGKIRSRKQVSSHIQVLARRRGKDYGPGRQLKVNVLDEKKRCLDLNQRSSCTPKLEPSDGNLNFSHSSHLYTGQHAGELSRLAQHQELLSRSPGPNLLLAGATAAMMTMTNHSITNVLSSPFNLSSASLLSGGSSSLSVSPHSSPFSPDNFVAPTLRLQGSAAYVETAFPYERHYIVQISPESAEAHSLEPIGFFNIADKFPPQFATLLRSHPRSADTFFLAKIWASLDSHLIDQSESQFAASHRYSYEGTPRGDIIIETQVLSFGNVVVEKTEHVSPQVLPPNAHCSMSQSLMRGLYEISRSSLCDYTTTFIRKLKRLPSRADQDQVLENFTILQLFRCKQTTEVLLGLAYIFQVSSTPSVRLYRLKDGN